MEDLKDQWWVIASHHERKNQFYIPNPKRNLKIILWVISNYANWSNARWIFKSKSVICKSWQYLFVSEKIVMKIIFWTLLIHFLGHFSFTVSIIF